MTFTAKIKIQYTSKWDSKGGIYDNEELPEENVIFEVPAEDLNTVQFFKLFRNFMLAIGHNQRGIDKGAMSLVFNEMRDIEDMRKTADEYDLVMIEDHNKEMYKLEAEIRDLKAKLSRALNPDNPNYTESEIEAMCDAAEKEELRKKLEKASVVCFDCGKKYGEYHDGVSSVWEGTCNVCGETKSITESRDFNYLMKGIRELG